MRTAADCLQRAVFAVERLVGLEHAETGRSTARLCAELCWALALTDERVRLKGPRWLARFVDGNEKQRGHRSIHLCDEPEIARSIRRDGSVARAHAIHLPRIGRFLQRDTRTCRRPC